MIRITKSQHGFSLIEMITATVIVTVFVLGIATLLVQFGVQQEGLRGTINMDLDYQLTERVVSRDMLNAAPSLNNVISRDDSGLGFFDYYPDVTPTNYSGSIQRTLTLGQGRRSEIYFVLTDSRQGSPMMYDPTAAYSFGVPPANMNTAGVWSFVSVNRNGYIDRLNPKLWQDGRLLMLDTPARVRSSVAARERPRSPFFVGQVQGQSLQAVALAILERRDPTTGELIDSADKFFRRAPAMSGGSPVVRLKAVQVVRYYTRNSVLKPGHVDVYRQTYDRGSFIADQLFAKDVKSLRFTRASIFQPVFSFQIVTDRSKGEVSP